MAETIPIPIGDKAKELIPINTSLGDYVSRGISAIILLAGIATFAYMVWGGLDWILSGGSKDKVQEARQKITNAVIGLAVVAAAWALYALVDYFFGIGIVE